MLKRKPYLRYFLGRWIGFAFMLSPKNGHFRAQRATLAAAPVSAAYGLLVCFGAGYLAFTLC